MTYRIQWSSIPRGIGSQVNKCIAVDHVRKSGKVALGPIAHFMTGNLYLSLNIRMSGCSIGAALQLCSNASATGFGGFTVRYDLHITNGQCIQQEAMESSTQGNG